MVFDKTCEGQSWDWSFVQAWLIGFNSRTKNYHPEGVAATLLAGSNSYSKPITPEDLTIWTIHREHLFEQDSIYQSIYSLADNCTRLEVMTSDFAYAVTLACDNRRGFETEDGQLGLGPKAMRPGDIVAVFYGCRCPYVLRPCGQHFKIVGACYVDGVMYGEAVKKHKADGNADDVFVLC